MLKEKLGTIPVEHSEDIINEKFDWMFNLLKEMKEDERIRYIELQRRLDELDDRLFGLNAKIVGEACGLGGVVTVLVNLLMNHLKTNGQ